MSVELSAGGRQARWLAAVGCGRSSAGRKAQDGGPQAGPGVCPLDVGKIKRAFPIQNTAPIQSSVVCYCFLQTPECSQVRGVFSP